MPTPTAIDPTVVTAEISSCSLITAQIAALEHEEISLSAANDTAQIRCAAARNAYESAKHLADVSERRLMRNRYKQLTLQDDFNTHGC